MNLLDSWKYLNKSASCGIDRMSAKEYEMNLGSNVKELVAKLKRKGYRAKLVRRKYIPKTEGKLRPLGIPATEDKLLQVAVARILNAIFEQEFLPCSFGYRIGRSARMAIKELHYELQYGWFGYVVEADIKGYFENIDHEWIIKMLEERINDKAFIGLIRKWLKAGIMEPDKMVVHPATGTPQGGVVSPVLANIYLHYVLDLWFEKKIKQKSEGRVYLCRYADDFVCLFQFQRDAEKFYQELPKRLEKFGLNLSKEKTRIISFSKHRMEENSRFDFLGFEFRWSKGRMGQPQIKRRTSREKLKKSLANFTQWCKENRNLRIREMMDKLNKKLKGYYEYYGIIGNSDSLRKFYRNVERILKKWLNRRSQRKSYTWQGFKIMLKQYPILKPRITESRSYQLNIFHSNC
ncbi:MAG: group II intron reverse transcriptase/maturase [Melioribacteraceae bacterium]